MWGLSAGLSLPPARFPTELDLSMEVMEWLKQSIARVDAESKEELKLRALLINEEDCTATTASSEDLTKAEVNEETQRWHDDTLAKHAAVAVSDVVSVMRRFYPDMTRHQLETQVHSIVYADKLMAVSCGIGLRNALRSLVPWDRRDWIVEDLSEHIAASRGVLSGPRWLGLQAHTLRKDPLFRTMFVAGSGSAVALGVAGAPLGMAAGAVTGALIGIGPAFFTFGLSIPVFAVVGGGVGACAGAVAGAGAGLFGGSAIGGLGHAYRAELKEMAEVFQNYTQAKKEAFERALLKRSSKSKLGQVKA